ncbi:MAG: hypothetical protein GY786_05370 [Proteobacteria bacterium]|nr:hypothetical protein [Pseudomonadota bacterium]
MIDIGEKIASVFKECRQKTQLSQSSMAEKLETPLRTYQSWEKSFTSSIENYLKICHTLEIDASELLKAVSDTKNENFKSNEGLKTIARDTHLILKERVVRKALEGDSVAEIFSWLTSRYPEKAELVHNELDFINNCILDLYHSKHQIFREIDFKRDLKKEQGLGEILGIPKEQVIVSNSGGIKLKLLREIIIAKHGAAWIVRWSGEKSGYRLGIAGGRVSARILNSIPRGSVSNITLFPLNFTYTPVDLHISSIAQISTFLYRQNGYGMLSDTTNEEEVYGSMLLADAVFLGLGTFSNNEIYEQIIRSRLGQKMVRKVKEMKIEGDFNYHLLDKKGKEVFMPEIVSDIGDTKRKSLIKSISLKHMQDKADKGGKVVITITGSTKKADIAKSVFRRQYANHLITDDKIADKILMDS